MAKLFSLLLSFISFWSHSINWVFSKLRRPGLIILYVFILVSCYFIIPYFFPALGNKISLLLILIGIAAAIISSLLPLFEYTFESKYDKRIEIGDINGSGNVIGNYSNSSIQIRPEFSTVLESHEVRVLNANFGRSSRDKLLKPREGLEAGEECFLLIDIGPRWRNSASIAKGNIDLSELLTSDFDYIVQVVFISEDFEPKISSTEIWIPAYGGRSFPVINGQKVEEPGPVAILLRAPRFSDSVDEASFVAHGRLCLYYENYLLQSAIVSVGVVQDPKVKLHHNNGIKVDYLLTGNLHEVKRRFSNRRIRIGAEDPVGQAVALNLTLNDDGYGNHRILVKNQSIGHQQVNLPPAWKKYDPLGGIEFLAQFRRELIGCYAEFDSIKYKNQRQKFITDLTALAVVGSKLYANVFSDLTIPAGLNPWDWEEKFREITSKATVIQVSRTGPASYVFPWAMVYEYPLVEDEQETFEICQTLKVDWDKNAFRTKNAEGECPHLEEHLETLTRAKQTGKTIGIICPYAFWGYKHIIEQPLSSLDSEYSAPDFVETGGEIILSVGITHDIDQGEKHLNRLKSLLSNVKLDPLDPADNRDSVQQMLRAPKVVYFLCHGDGNNGQSYISIGLHDGRPIHKVTANTLAQWKRSTIDKSAWQRIHPLIFINGCGTADLRPGLTFNLVSAFADLEAGGVIGTEVSVDTNTAYPAAEHILRRSADGIELGRAVREMRWELLKHGNLLGLAYTPYGLADLRIK